MTHLVDIDGLYEKLFILEHVSHGSFSYCSLRKPGGAEDPGNGAFDEYWGWAKAIVSSMVIDISIRLRMIDDYCHRNVDEDFLERLPTIAGSPSEYMKVLSGDVRQSMRECANKVVHAERVQLVYTSQKDNCDWRYWSGDLDLWGIQGDKAWQIRMHIAPWTRAVKLLLEELERNEVFMYMGQESSE